jgi:meso-butanediol dehydrogenase/(S,S)-butanediol dehydrogenase/diacetyl reductase
MNKKALVFGSSGNLGPIWCSTLRGLQYDVKEFDPPGWDAKNTAKLEVPKGYLSPDVIVYNAAIDNPPGYSTRFFTNLVGIVDVNLFGACRVTEAFLPHMMSKGGLFIYVGSIQGIVGADWRNYDGDFEKPVGYNVSKAALMQLTRSVAVQYGRYNIRAVCLAFAAVETGKFTEPFKSKFLNCLPLGRFISKESVAASLKFAISCPELTGQTVLIDGGYTAW